MTQQSAKEAYIEYFRTRGLLREVVEILPLKVARHNGKRRTDKDLKPLVESIRKQAEDIGIAGKLFERFLGLTLDGLLEGTSPRALANHVQAHADRVRRRIYAVPNSLDKAHDALRALVEVDDWRTDQEYDAFVLLSGEISKSQISREIDKWKKDAKHHEAEGRASQTAIFWNSLDNFEDIDGVSRYRFREHFHFAEFASAFSEVESMFESNIAPAVAGMSEMRDIHGSSELKVVCYELWLASRSARLCNRIENAVSLALENVAVLQSPEGWWADTDVLVESNNSDITRRPRYLPSAYLTALCTINLLKLSIKDSERESGILGARWLLPRQNVDGSWSRERIAGNRIEYQPGIFVTVLVLEALIRSGISNIQHSIDSGMQWLLGQQQDFGTWDDEGFPTPFMTVLVLELSRLRQTYHAALNHYQSICRGFMFRSRRLIMEDNANSRRLAVIACYHGLEAFLYSLLSHPSINVPIFMNKSDKTIGMREALREFESHVQKAANTTQAVLNRNSLDRLAYLRDQIVHKAIDVTESECKGLVFDAQEFVEKYSLQVFHFDVLS